MAKNVIVYGNYVLDLEEVAYMAVNENGRSVTLILKSNSLQHTLNFASNQICMQFVNNVAGRLGAKNLV